MANSKSSGEFYEYATVDTNPDSDGFWTNEISIRYKRRKSKIEGVVFSIREYEPDSSGASDTSVATVSLQFKCPGDLGWQDYKPLDGSTFAVGNRIFLEDVSAGVVWRAGVKDGDFSSGSITFGFDW
jgi:hypothetical protein